MFYEVSIKIKEQTEEGKIRKRNEIKLVKTDGGFVDVQTLITKMYEGYTFDWAINSMKESKIDEFVTQDKIIGK